MQAPSRRYWSGTPIRALRNLVAARTRVARDELEAGDSGRAVRVLGSRSAGDAQGARGDILDQEGQKPAVLAYAGYPPLNIRPVREPSPADGGAVHVETAFP
jgi:hypothetical protein